MSTISATSGQSQISPADERMFRQSNLLGLWKGHWSNNHGEISFKVVRINGATAQIEYTHNGHTERGTGTVNGSTITYGTITIGAKDSSNAGLVFSYGGFTQKALMEKQAETTEQNKLVGSWIGRTGSQSVSFKVASIDGRNVQVTYTQNGTTTQGTGDLFRNSVVFNKASVTTTDGIHGKVFFQAGNKTMSANVTKYVAGGTASSSVNKTA